MPTLTSTGRFAALTDEVASGTAYEGQPAFAAVRDRVGEASDVDDFVPAVLLQLPERHGFDLPDPLAGDPHLLSYLLQRHPLGVRLDGSYRLGVFPPFEFCPGVPPDRRRHVLQLQPQRQSPGSNSHAIPIGVMGIDGSATLLDLRTDFTILGYRCEGEPRR